MIDRKSYRFIPVFWREFLHQKPSIEASHPGRRITEYGLMNAVPGALLDEYGRRWACWTQAMAQKEIER
jgi:hypothetical protein